MNDDTRPAAPGPSYLPEIRTVTPGDIAAALKAGVADFLAAPLFGLFFGGVCAAAGLIMLASLTSLDITWMMIPIAIGFPLVGPFIALGLYEVSRRRAAGLPLKWRDILLVIFNQKERQFGYIGIVILCVFWVWVFIARILFALFLGAKSFASVGVFVTTVLTTTNGLGFLAVGSAFGAVLAYVLFSATVISMPMLVDRDIDVISAIITSFNSVFKSPLAMIGWGIVIAALVILALLPFFLGLIVVLPILGHATWHLYVTVIGKAESAEA